VQYGKSMSDLYRETFTFQWRQPRKTFRHLWYMTLEAFGTALLRLGWALRYRAACVFERLINDFTDYEEKSL